MRQDSPGAAEGGVPFVDLSPVHAPLKEGILADIAALIDAGTFTGGAVVERFEADFARYCGRAHCVGVSSGLDALRLSLLGAGLQPGEKVVVPALTFIATAEAVVQAGGVPVLADIDDSDCNLDPAAAEAAVGERTRFLLPVHLYGQLADMARLESIAARRRIRIVEDACQAHGAKRDGRQAGRLGLASCFSFYPAKNLGALGDAGAALTDDSQLAARLRALREHGERESGDHELLGYTARLDAVQAVALLRKLPLLDRWNGERRGAATFYSDALRGVGDLRLPQATPGSEPVWHLYVVRTGDPDALRDFLGGRGIETGRHYPRPLHLTSAFAGFGHPPGAFPVAEAVAREGLSLPIFPGISEEQLGAVVAGVAAYFERGS
jgi:dTDP-4-amino-4,6-dideoxygalactose transaminase